MLRPPDEPPRKKVKRGPGRPRKICAISAIVIDSDKSSTDECDTDENNTDESSTASTETPVEPGVELTVRRLYSVNQKKKTVAYARMHSVSAASKHLSIPRTTINCWMEAGYFDREVTKMVLKRSREANHIQSSD